MISKETIKKEIDNIPEERLEDLHQLLKEFSKSKNSGGKGNLMTKLRQIKIQGPKDFSKNIDAYLSGEISG